MAQEFPSAELSEDTASADPFVQFGVWFRAASEQLPEPNAMALSTCSTHSFPSSRMVLLKEWDARGFVFYTNYGSRKGQEIEHNAHVALLFFWGSLQRQIRIEGTASHCTREESQAYFRTRPRGAQIGAWASVQSTVVTRDALDRRVVELEAEYAGREVPVPPFWGGIRVAPSAFEFWQGRQHRLHDRLRYVHAADKFRIERLAP